MTPREALDVVNPPHGDCNCEECHARAVLLRVIEQHEARAEADERRERETWAGRGRQ